MDRLSLLREKNPGLVIHTVDDKLFTRYARLVSSPVFRKIADHIDRTTIIPDRNTYVADIPELHTKEIDDALCAFYGGLVPQIGWCNGKNYSMNGSEYHKGPELTIAITDCLMWWMLPEDLVDFNHAASSRAEVFYIPKGCAFLLKPEILHLAPCKVDSAGYKTVIILPMGTNRPLDPDLKAKIRANGDPESKLLHMSNKYMITHKDWEPLVSQGVHVGLLGDNRKVEPID